MNVLKRILSLLLVCVFVGAALVGCGNNKGNGDGQSTADQGDVNNSGVTEKETNIYGEPSFTTANDYRALDFEGEELTVMIRRDEVAAREWYKESPEDELDEAVAMRNVAVEEELNLHIDFEITPCYDFTSYLAVFQDMVINDVMSDLHYYDVAVHFALGAGYANVRDCHANVLDNKQFPYFDFSLPCWNQSVVNGTVVNDRLHLICGDVNISQFDYANVFWYNKTLYDNKKEVTDHEDIQDLALEGLWTYDELYMWATRLHEDSNGTTGWQADDTYGYAEGPANVNTQPVPKDSMAAAFDIDLLLENPDGTHSYNIVGNDKAEKALTMFRNLFDATGTCEQATVGNFAAGKYVFYASTIYPGKDANMQIREMEDTYGLLPIPKYDIDQEQYGTTATDGYSLMGVLDHNESTIPTKGEAVSAYLQLMTEESYTSVRGYYFNRIIKPKYFGTDDSEGTVTNSIALFDIIVDNIEFDYCTIYSPQLNNVNHLWRGACYSSGTLESLYQAKKDAYEKAIMETDAWLGLRAPIEE